MTEETTYCEKHSWLTYIDGQCPKCLTEEKYPVKPEGKFYSAFDETDEDEK